MGAKKRVQTLYEARNGCPMASLGDKIYKAPEYQTGYFNEGGLIAGSTNKARTGSQGNGKAIDFYAGLRLDTGPLNKGMKTYVQVCKEQELAEECGDVKDLKGWERNILKEVDENYDPDDDSSDEEAIAYRAQMAAEAEEKAAQEAAEAEKVASAQGARKQKK